MTHTFGLAMLLVLAAALLYTTAYYAITANFMRYAAGQSFMALLVSLDLLVGYTAAVRLTQIEHRAGVFDWLIVLLIGAVLFVQRVMRHEYVKARAARNKAFTPRIPTPPNENPGEKADD